MSGVAAVEGANDGGSICGWGGSPPLKGNRDLPAIKTAAMIGKPVTQAWTIDELEVTNAKALQVTLGMSPAAC